jgi:hypothetical protein
MFISFTFPFLVIEKLESINNWTGLQLCFFFVFLKHSRNVDFNQTRRTVSTSKCLLFFSVRICSHDPLLYHLV